jgi:multidrug efflux pump subunit AcrB
MWIVRLALSRPYTFIVMALLILISGVVAIVRTPTDVFPLINIPVVSVIWSYSGLPPDEMANRVTGQFERAATTTVNDIEHIESQSLSGLAIIKLFFHPQVRIEGAIAQVTSIAQTMIRNMPPGATPPLIIMYTASSVPILQLGLSSKQLSEQQLFDVATSQIRTQLATIEGASIPWPYGGKQRLIAVDLDPRALQAKGISGTEVINAINEQNLVQPQGTAKIGDREYSIEMNSSLKLIQDINDLPLKTVNGTILYVRDVAYVHDGSSVQSNIVRQDGHRGALLTVMKNGGASTLDIVDRVLKALPPILAGVPESLEVRKTLDQSVFVRAAVDSVIKEGVVAAGLTSLLMLLFLGSWRSTLIVVVSIPLSILTSLAVLSALGETINLITLGGLALAVGILVDDATVEIENINRLRALQPGESDDAPVPGSLATGSALNLRNTILLGAQQIAVPALVSTLSICIVFVPIFFLKGIAGYLFRPLAEAVVFAMLASYLLSRTLVPTLVLYLFRSERKRPHRTGGFHRLHQAFESWFDAVRDRYREALAACLRHRAVFVLGFLVLCGGITSLLAPWLGADLFPEVDTGQIRLHVRGPTGMRVEETAALCDRIEGTLRKEIPQAELKGVLDTVGLPYSGINLSYSTGGAIGTSDAEILISLQPGHRPIAEHVRHLRRVLPRAFPGTEFFFQPAGIVNQILNFGLPAPIDVQIAGGKLNENHAIARDLLKRIRQIPGAADAHIHQLFDLPKLRVEVDRTRAEGVGFTQRDVANNVQTTLGNSFQTAPNFWVSPQGIVYNIVAQTPQYRVDSLDTVRNLPVISADNRSQVLSNLANVSRQTGPAVVNRYNTQPTIDIYVTPQDRDLGGVAAEIRRAVLEIEAKLPRGSQIQLRGQAETMRSSFEGLGIGLAFSVVLVYLLMVVNFQSWADPFIISTALPGALAGIVWMLFVTGTTVNVPSLMGAIMSIGVATSNSVLLVSFAASQMREGKDSIEAALVAGHTRFRPILMTAIAMMVGMLPMALGLGEGGEQNAPLGRAVIGGLAFATVATLLFVPVVFSLLRRKGYHGLLDEIEVRP